MFQFVKVFGERNSGTNFLNLMLQGNGVDATILNKEVDFLPSEYALSFDEAIRDVFVERWLDDLDREEFRRNFGWKHARVSRERLGRHPEFERAFFILLIRNPFSFVASLHRRPYNLLPVPKGDRKGFIRSPIMANERDHLDSVYVPSPVDLWCQKAVAAIEFALTGDNACLVRYEDVMADTVGFIRWLSRRGLRFQSDDVVQVASTKRDPISFQEYRDKTLAFDPEKEFDREDYQDILGRIPEKLLDILRYNAGRIEWPASPWANPVASMFDA